MTMHEEWTDQLSDYVDDELHDTERADVEAHLRGCAECTSVLNDLKGVVARARSLDARPPQADLWSGIRRRTDVGPLWMTRSVAHSQPGRVSFTILQLAAAAVILVGVSAGVSWRLAGSSREASRETQLGRAQGSPAETAATDSARGDDVGVIGVSLADGQFDAAVADLEKALKHGRGKLDTSTIAIVEQNLQTIDQAIAQAREALAADPANSYLSSHLFEARRRKLDLLRRATALTDMD